MTSLTEILEKRIENSLIIRQMEEEGKSLLRASNFDDFSDRQPLIEELFLREEKLSKEMDFLQNASGEKDTDTASKHLREKCDFLKHIMQNALTLLEENHIRLERMIDNILRAQRENNNAGNVVSKYHPRQKTIPKFIDIKN